MKGKRCSKCGKVKKLGKFDRNKNMKDGHNYRCKKCMKEYSQSGKGKEARKRYNQSEKRKESWRQYFRSEKGKKVLKRHNQTIQRRIATNLRSRIRYVLKGVNKSASTIELLGCSIKEFLAYIQSLFRVGMTWDNYGSYWEIDHIIPCSAYDLTDPKQQKECFHYTNLQPLYWKDNLSKGNRI